MKKLLIILILILLNYLSYRYLIVLNKAYKPFIPIQDSFLLVQTKNIKIYDESDFIFDDYFKVLSFSNYSIKDKFIDNTYHLEITTSSIKKDYQFDVTFLEPEVIVNTITEYIYLDKEDKDTSSNNPTNNTINNNKTYFDVYQTSFSYETNTSLQTIINDIANSFECSEEVMIDYSSLNPSVEGTYTVTLISSIKNISISVLIY